MYCHCGTNNRAPRRSFTDPCKPEVRPGAREDSAFPAWLAKNTSTTSSKMNQNAKYEYHTIVVWEHNRSAGI